MTIPEYDEVMCPYCSYMKVCDKSRFKVKVKKSKEWNDLKYSFCKQYKYSGKREDVQ